MISFTDIFNKVNDTHSIRTRSATDGLLYKSNYNLTKYGLNSIYNLCIKSWNELMRVQKDIIRENSQHMPVNLHGISRSNLKKLITKYLLDTYQD